MPWMQEPGHGGMSLCSSPEYTLLERHSMMYFLLQRENNSWETTTWEQGAALFPSLLDLKAPGIRSQPLRLLPAAL